MEEKQIEKGTRIGENIAFYKNKNKFPQKIMPDIKINACASCDKSLWTEHSKNGPTCFCTVSHTITYQYIWHDGGFVLNEQIFQCTNSRLVSEEEQAEIIEKQKEEIIKEVFEI